MTAQLVQKKLGRQGSRNNPTRRVRLVGGDINDLAKFRNDCIQQYSTLWPEQICLQLVSSYGTRIDEIAQLCRHRPDLAELLARGGDTIAAQVVWAAQHESVVHLTDILLRRTDLCLLGNPGDTVLERCAQLAGDVLNWSEERRQAELESLRIELGRSIPAA
jgi:glycerol-3-phosphate dehydrogenase